MLIGQMLIACASLQSSVAVVRRTSSRLAMRSTRHSMADGGVQEMVGTLERLTEHCTGASEADTECIEQRQLTHKISSMMAVGKRCKYGFPQALVTDPLGRLKFGLGGHPVDAALFRLTCPHLVKGLDEWEAKGAVKSFNEKLLGDARWTEANTQTNAQHRLLRRALIGTEEKIAELEQNPVHAIIVNSGLAGLTKPGDVKCLHAQVADGLCRGGNVIADDILEGLKERGYEADGCGSCWQQCNLKHEPTPDSWRYAPVKNRQKLRTASNRRRALKEKLAGRAAEKLEWPLPSSSS
ncbi:hypothetical protein T492DRAFT_1084982 [Pavlovales sp. CCMP2436]|nr:hypothetical protein T492DRAFT_1084982 [Pavlovales sp. CCMP2436]